MARSSKVLADLIFKVSTDIADLKNGTNDINNQLKGFGKTLTKIGNLVGVAFAADAVIDFAREASRAAAEAEGVFNAFQRLNRPELLQQVRTATQGVINDLEIARAAVKFNNFNLPLDQLANLLQFVQLRAQQTGESFEFLRDSLVEGLSKESKLRIDNLGISVIALNKELETAGTFTEAVANIANRELSKAGGVIETTATVTERWGAKLDNIKLKIGDDINAALGITLSILEEIEEVLTPKTTTREVLVSEQSIRKTQQQLSSLITSVNKTFLEYEQATDKAIDAGDNFAKLLFKDLDRIESDTSDIQPKFSIDIDSLQNDSRRLANQAKLLQQELADLLNVAVTEIDADSTLIADIVNQRVEKFKSQLDTQFKDFRNAVRNRRKIIEKEIQDLSRIQIGKTILTESQLPFAPPIARDVTDADVRDAARQIGALERELNTLIITQNNL
jgi:hypothetical protein